MSPKGRNTIRLSPLSRLTMSFDQELNLDNNKVLGLDTYEKYLDRYKDAEAKRDKLLAGLAKQLSILFLVLFGQDWTIPVLDVQLSSIPAIREILLVTTSLTFFMLCTSFVTHLCYGGIIDQYGNRIVNSNVVDPDFFNASRKHYDFFLKVYRAKLNIWGGDFFESAKGFRRFSVAINTIFVAIIIAMISVHFLIVGFACWQIFISEANIAVKVIIAIVVSVVNFAGVALVVGLNKKFDFLLPIVEQNENNTPEGNSGTSPE